MAEVLRVVNRDQVLILMRYVLGTDCPVLCLAHSQQLTDNGGIRDPLIYGMVLVAETRFSLPLSCGT